MIPPTGPVVATARPSGASFGVSMMGRSSGVAASPLGQQSSLLLRVSSTFRTRLTMVSVTDSRNRSVIVLRTSPGFSRKYVPPPTCRSPLCSGRLRTRIAIGSPGLQNQDVGVGCQFSCRHTADDSTPNDDYIVGFGPIHATSLYTIALCVSSSDTNRCSVWCDPRTTSVIIGRGL